MATISMSRDELLAKLLEAKARADQDDARKAAAHAKEEQAALMKFRERLKAAMKWDYETAKKSYSVRLDSPSCPSRSARPIELAITQVKLDSRKGRFYLSEGSDWFKAATWLPESKRPKQSICD
jgi:hypothetical protein